jgi:pimeloyl-ACP methyl ester carboxylesterase
MARRSKSSGRNGIGRAAAYVVAAPLAVAALGWLFQRAGLRRDARRFPPQGMLLSRRGRYLHVLQQGGERPAVVFEAGLAASSLSWARVQPMVAAFAATTSYDRAGLGWSSRCAAPPTLQQMLDDLFAVTRWAAADAPVVLVAHSFGALLALAFAHQHPERVAGLVLVDPVSIAHWSDCSDQDRLRLQAGAQLSRRGAWLAEFGVVRAALLLLLKGGQRLSRRIGRHAAGRGGATLERLTGEVGKLPRELWPAIAAHWSRAQSFRTMADTLEVLPACAEQSRLLSIPVGMPVAILSAATAKVEELAEREGWLAPLETKQHRVLAESGHWLHLERPQAVAEAIAWCLERAGLLDEASSQEPREN